jgi:ADP-ribose pyrophosphatase YjhB (NUDIX family)
MAAPSVALSLMIVRPSALALNPTATAEALELNPTVDADEMNNSYEVLVVRKADDPYKWTWCLPHGTLHTGEVCVGAYT